MKIFLIALLITLPIIMAYLWILSHIQDYLWCAKFYAMLGEKSEYNAYKDILNGAKHQFCTLDEYVHIIVKYEFPDFFGNVSLPTYDPDTYYIITDKAGVKKNDKWVICGFFKLFMKDIFEKIKK